MVERIILLATIMMLTFVSCKKDLKKLSLTKIPYTGQQLRTEGFYYSNPYPDDPGIGIAILYRNGVCMHITSSVNNKDTITFIENEVLLNMQLMTRLWTKPSSIGVFQINGNAINLENWVAGLYISEKLTTQFRGKLTT